MEKIIVKLTARRSVEIDPSEWPVLARAKGDSSEIKDRARYVQAKLACEFDEYQIVVRGHEDGRVLVYAIFEAGELTGNASVSGGVILEKPTERRIMNAVRNVGEMTGIPGTTIQKCYESFKPNP